MPRRISSLQQAVVVLGLRTVKVMVLTFSLVDAMQRQQAGDFDYRGYWQRSLTTAVAARLLGETLPSCRADEAFVTGLLSDIGMLAAIHVDRLQYERVLCRSTDPRKPLYVIEQELLGVSHDVIGGELLNSWGLPPSISAAVASHHQPLEQPIEGVDAASRCLAMVLRAAVTAPSPPNGLSPLRPRRPGAG